MQAAAQQAKAAVEAVQQVQPAVNDELKRALLDFTKSTLEAVKDSAHATVDFAKEQVPLVLQEIVRATVLNEVALLAFFLLLLGLALYFASKLDTYTKWCRSNNEVHRDSYDFAQPVKWIIRVVAPVLFGGLSLLHLYHALYAWWFPRLTILEYLTNLAKQVSS